MPISLRIPAHKIILIKQFAQKNGMSQTAVILDAVDEKIGLKKGRPQHIRELSGWMTHEEAEELRNSSHFFDQINEGDWE